MEPSGTELKTVLELDLASYSDIARVLEENLSVNAVKAFEDQVQSFVDDGLNHVGLSRKDVVLESAGDNAILVFDDATVMHQFVEAVQQAVTTHNRQKTVESAKRWFRMGAATGPVLLLQPERRIVGTTVARAVRLEAAAKNGQILVDPATFNLLRDGPKQQYGPEEIIAGKRDERFAARQCTFVWTDAPASQPVTETRSRPRSFALAILLLGMTAATAAGIAWALRMPHKTEEKPGPDPPKYHVIPAVEIAPPPEGDDRE
jgi:class 3 adenylate cyclase